MERKSETLKPEAFYSYAAGLTFWPQESQRVIEGGQSKVVDGEPIAFTPIGDGFGRYVTNNPDKIAALKHRMEAVGDIFDGTKYVNLTTPKEIKLAEQEREIQTQNRLLKQLQEERLQLLEKLEDAKKGRGGVPSNAHSSK